MLELRNIKKTYHVGDIETKALDGVSVAFRQKEFVAILGTSGSGKTTCLNIIGGLDRYDSGELIIKGKPTSSFKDNDWDAYRNNSVGFVFQSYNLIMHLSIVENVELGMTLSGVNRKEKHQRAIEVLKQVGLAEHLHKKPNQLSGGQMQRVAIARALANDPEILLCDEPTGALDSMTSVQIMDLIQSIAADRLVIMVTHNPDLAEKYADRIIRFKDGQIVTDSNPFYETPLADQFQLKKTSMSFFTALNLSFNNIKTKLGRTALTAFASSIGIIGIAVILSLSSGFQVTIDNYQKETMSQFPIVITQQSTSVDMEDIETMREEMMNQFTGNVEFEDTDAMTLYDPSEMMVVHTNKLNKEYMDYIENIDPSISSSIGYTRIVAMNMLRKENEEIKPVSIASSSSSGKGMSAMTSMGLSSFPKPLSDESKGYLEKNYDLLAGSYPKDATDLVLVVDTKNRVDVNILKSLGYPVDVNEEIKFDELIGDEFKIIPNDSYYIKTPFNSFLPGTDYEAMYNDVNAITVKIVGVLRQSQDTTLGVLKSGIAYSDELSQLVLDMNLSSEIVAAQKESDQSVFTMETLDEETKQQSLAYLGGEETPYMVMIYPIDFESKDSVLSYLDDFNTGKAADNQIIYNDLAGTMSDMTKGIMDAITYVLIAFAAISLVVSLIMIAIITYTSVLERTKEIGVLKALGARKKDVTRVFDAETTILGIFSGVLGVIIAYLCTFPINMVIYNLTQIENVAELKIEHAVLLVIVSTLLTILGGHIPARMASKKDAVDALRSE